MSLIHSSVSIDHFISNIELTIFDQIFPVFSSSLFKFSLCSSNLYANSVISLITNDLSSLSGKSFISVSLVSYSGSFSCSFIWSKFLCLLILLSSLCFGEIR